MSAAVFVAKNQPAFINRNIEIGSKITFSNTKNIINLSHNEQFLRSLLNDLNISNIASGKSKVNLKNIQSQIYSTDLNVDFIPSRRYGDFGIPSKVELIKLGMVKNLLSTNTQSNIYGISSLGIARITESGRQTLGIDTLNFKIY